MLYSPHHWTYEPRVPVRQVPETWARRPTETGRCTMEMAFAIKLMPAQRRCTAAAFAADPSNGKHSQSK